MLKRNGQPDNVNIPAPGPDDLRGCFPKRTKLPSIARTPSAPHAKCDLRIEAHCCDRSSDQRQLINPPILSSLDNNNKNHHNASKEHQASRRQGPRPQRHRGCRRPRIHHPPAQARTFSLMKSTDGRANTSIPLHLEGGTLLV